jgi:hypothetical protein
MSRLSDFLSATLVVGLDNISILSVQSVLSRVQHDPRARKPGFRGVRPRQGKEVLKKFFERKEFVNQSDQTHSEPINPRGVHRILNTVFSIEI